MVIPARGGRRRSRERPQVADDARATSAMSSADGATEPWTLTVRRSVPQRVGRALVVVLVLVGVGHVAAVVLAPSLQTLDVLHLAEEESIGTWLTAVAHLACAVLSAGAALVHRRQGTGWARNWWLLSAVFALMSIDEVAAGHDRLVRPLRDAFGTTGLLYYAWVVPALVLVVVVVVLQLGFLRNLDAPTRRGLVLAGAIFVLGAAGLEMVEGVVASGDGDPLVYQGLVLVEEVMELGGLMLAACVVLRHLIDRLDEPRVTLLSGARAA